MSGDDVLNASNNSGAREAVARAMRAQVHGNDVWDSLHGRLKMVYLEDAGDALNAITAAGYVVTTPTAIAAEIRAWAERGLSVTSRDSAHPVEKGAILVLDTLLRDADAIASRICGGGNA
jgi:hypothetical protein